SVKWKLLNNDTSWLLKPGRMNFALLQLFPISRRPMGRWNIDVLNHRSTVLWSRGRFALPVCTTPQVSPPPEKSKLSVVEKLTSDGSPLANVVTPETCQSSSTTFETFPGISLLPCGRSTT